MTQITLTPIITQFNETLVGLDTIRAYKLEKYFLDKIVAKTNDNHKVFLTEQMTLRWFMVGMGMTFRIFISDAFIFLLSMRCIFDIDLVIAVFIFVVALLATLLRDQFPTALLSLSVGMSII